jgi:hypothetical protein
MVEPARPDDRVTYEIRVQGELPAWLLERYPSLDVQVTAAETVLHRNVDDLADLDRLFEQLQSLGLVLCELRETPLPGADPAPATTEGGGEDA